MEPGQRDPPSLHEQITLYAAWYRILLLRLPSQAPPGRGLLESPMDTLFVRLSRNHIAVWGPERLHSMYSHLFSLAEEAFFQWFSPRVTVPRESGVTVLVRA